LQIAEWQLFGQSVDFDYQGNTAIKKKPVAQLRIYPNPAKDEIIIDNGGLKKENKHLQITDISGKTIGNFQFSTSNSQLIINVASFPAGVYIVKTGDFCGKFIKKP
jgi:hypothetical protein